MKEGEKRDLNEPIEELNLSTLFFSNKLEYLFDCLAEQLFSSETSFFTPRIIIVPSQAIDQWLRFKIAERFGIATGITTLYLAEGINAKAVSKLSLTLSIAESLDQAFSQEEEMFLQASRYCAGHPKRKILLAQKLASHFKRYSLYGVDQFPQAFEQKLWELMCSTYPELKQPFLKQTTAVHLFGHNHLPVPVFEHFKNQNSYFYLLSPCKEFWSDLYLEAKVGQDNPQPLLLGLGRVGRDVAKIAEESDVQIVQAYDDKNLSITQQALLNLNPLEFDESIEIHAAPSLLREVEILYDHLLQEQVEPQDILIMAPDIKRYAPFLKAVFADLIYLDVQTAQIASTQLQAMELLLTLEEQRWSAPETVQILCHPLSKLHWSDRQIQTINRWIQKTGIRWGYDACYRQKHLGKAVQQGTWKYGWQQLLEALAYENELIDFPDVELLEELIETLQQLKNSLDTFYETRRPASAWGRACLDLYHQFFEAQEELLETLLEPLLHESHAHLYTFEEIYPLLEELLSYENQFDRRCNKQVICCDSMRPMRALPAKVICLLGMDHDLFPRYQTDMLDALKGRADVPSQADFDRYLFIEVLLSYRKKCFISYQGKDPCDGQIKPPSAVLDFLLGHVKHQIHPLQGYHTTYFTGKLATTCQSYYAIAKARQQPLSKHSLFSPPVVEAAAFPSQDIVITIDELLRAVRSPLRHYYSHIKFAERRSLNEQDALTLSPLSLAKLRKLALVLPKEEAIMKLQKQGDLPTGHLFDAIYPKILSECFAAASAHYELGFGIKKIEEIEPGYFLHPAFTLQIEQTRVHLVGSIGGLTSKGMLLAEKNHFTGAIKWWPLILITQAIGIADNWIFSQDEHLLAPFVKDPVSELKKMLHYYFISKQQLSPLYPTVVPALLDGKVDVTRVWDPAFKWALQTKELTESILAWQEIAQDLYQQMKQEWF